MNKQSNFQVGPYGIRTHQWGLDVLNGAANPPTLLLYVDAFPDPKDYVYEEVRDHKDSRSRIFWGSSDGFAAFFYHQPADETGYGGQVFERKVRDGMNIVTKRIKGPWSSRPGVVNRHFPHVMECILWLGAPTLWSKSKEAPRRMRTHIVVDHLKELNMSGLLLIQEVENDGEVTYLVAKTWSTASRNSTFRLVHPQQKEEQSNG